LRGVVPEYPRPNPTLPPSVMFHGLMFTLWMALLVMQTQLIATRRTETHMKLGAKPRNTTTTRKIAIHE
jgi:hypothetical protein